MKWRRAGQGIYERDGWRIVPRLGRNLGGYRIYAPDEQTTSAGATSLRAAKAKADLLIEARELVAEVEQNWAAATRATAGPPDRTLPARSDPKPRARIVNPLAGRDKLRREKACRMCGHKRGSATVRRRALTRHHLIPRSQGGDDVDANLVPICESCHAFVHSQPPGGSASVALRAVLDPAEQAYCIWKVGEARFDARYPLK
jgi:5-methylcytosine-specific restriction endonuclease McrA